MGGGGFPGHHNKGSPFPPQDLDAMYFCNTCNQPLCAKCREETHKARMFSRHEIVSLTKRTKAVHKKCRKWDWPPCPPPPSPALFCFSTLSALFWAVKSPTYSDAKDEPSPESPVSSHLAQLLRTQACGFFSGVHPSRIGSSSFPAAFRLSQHSDPFRSIS